MSTAVMLYILRLSISKMPSSESLYFAGQKVISGMDTFELGKYSVRLPVSLNENVS